jgi:hypothetical protein
VFNASNQRTALARKLMGLAGLGFIAAIYVPEHWQELTLFSLAILCTVVALTGYLLGWKARHDDNR